MIILDTPTIIYDAISPDSLTEKVVTRIYQADIAKELYICDVSIWEISLLIKNKSLIIDESASNFINLYLDYRNVEIIPIRPEVSELAESITLKFSKNSFDRMIAATTIRTGATLITPDTHFHDSNLIQTLW